MKKIVVVIFLISLLVGCEQSNNRTKDRILLKEIVINHSVEDSVYKHYGIYKEVYRIYNCTYQECTHKEIRTPDVYHGIDYYLNQFGDTVRVIYVDYTNYPRREE